MNIARLSLWVSLVFISASKAAGIEAADSCLPTIAKITHLATPLEVRADDHQAVLSDRSGALFVLDVTDPSNPTQLGSVLMAGAGDLSVQGDLVAVAVDDRELVLVDIGVAHDPRNVGRVTIEPSISGLVTDVGRVYVVTGDSTPKSPGTDRLVVVDSSDPEAPTIVARHSLGTDLGSAVAVIGGHVIVPIADFGLKLFDLSDAHHPVEISALELGEAPHDVVVADLMIHALVGRRLVVIDAANSTAPAVVGDWSSPGWEPFGLTVSDGVAAVYDGSGPTPPHTIHLLDVDDPTRPQPLDEIETERLLSDIALVGRTLYTTRFNSPYGGLTVRDVANPNDPRVLARIDEQRLRWVECHAGLALVPDNDRVNVFPLVPASELHPMGVYRGSRTIWAAVVIDDVAYLALDDFGIEAVDLVDPVNPTRIGWLYASVPAWRIAGAGDRLIVADGPRIAVIDISDPTLPTELGSFTMPLDRHAHVVSLSHEHLYVGTGNCGASSPCDDEIWVVDISDPGHPVFTAPIELPYLHMSDMAIAEGLAVVVFASNPDILVYDVSDPTRAALIGARTAPGDWFGFTDVEIAGDIALVAGGESAAMLKLDLTQPSDPVVRSLAFEDFTGHGVPVDGDLACVLLGGYHVGVINWTIDSVCQPPRRSGGRRRPGGAPLASTVPLLVSPVAAP